MTPAEYEKLISEISHEMTNSPELRAQAKIRFGRENKWTGASGFDHQIDVSMESSTQILLIECKHWPERNIEPEAFLTIWGRVLDIENGPSANEKRVRGVLVGPKDFNEGVYKLANFYRSKMSLFVATSVHDLVVKVHSEFVQPQGISLSQFGTPGIRNS
jgi:hypothetical protein